MLFQVQGSPCSTTISGPVITLEVPSEQYRCLSPITELPSPMPTPMPSPLPTPSKQRLLKLRNNSTESSNQENTADDTDSEASVTVERSSSDTSGADARVFFKSFGLKKLDESKPLVPLVVPRLVLNLSSPGTSPASSPVSSPKIKIKPAPLVIHNSNLHNFTDIYPPSVPIINVQDERGEILERFDSTPRQRSQSIDAGCSIALPSIIISTADELSTSNSATNGNNCIPPALTITCASPKMKRKRRTSIAITETVLETDTVPNLKIINTPAPQTRQILAMYNSVTTPGSLNISENQNIIASKLLTIDSDAESPPHTKKSEINSSKFLSPFFGTAALHTSESNLSSSGYSSAYSPGPSRCNSNSPLFSAETDEPLTPSVSSIPSRPACLPNLHLGKNRLPSISISNHPLSEVTNVKLPISIPVIDIQPVLGRTDSETTDDPPTSQQDSALEVDTNDEPDTEIVDQSLSPKDLISRNAETAAQRDRILLSSSHSFPKESPRLQRFPPTIVVHTSLQSESSVDEYLADRPIKLSPVSSRSESPLSDSKLCVHKIHPAFFSKAGKLELPYTDSDGLYDCPSSEVLNSDSHHKTSPQRRPGRRKIKRSSMKCKGSYSGIGNQAGGASYSGVEPAAVGIYNHSEDPTTSSIPCNSRVGPISLEPPQHRLQRRVSPKRRARTQNNVDLLSSSNESITSSR